MDTFTDVHSGLQFCVKTENGCFDEMIKSGINEYSLIQWCEQFLTDDGVFVDIGAHIGTYSIILSKKCKQVYSFEAQKSTFDCLCVGVSLNNCFNVDLNNVALSSEEGNGTLHHLTLDGGSSTIRAEIPSLSNQSVIQEESVIMKRLDSFQLKDVDFLKIDVEGAELDVIKGASETLINNNYPPFIFEAWPEEWYRDDRDLLISYIKSLGYKVHPISGTTHMYLASDHILRKKKEISKEITPSKYDITILSKQYENGELLIDTFWEIWYELSKHYRCSNEYRKSLDCATKGLNTSFPVEEEYLLQEQIGIISYYIDQKTEGYKACDKVILSSHAPWSVRNYMLNNQSFYMRRIPFKKIIPINYNFPKDYIGSSASIIPIGDGFRCNVRCVNYSYTKDCGYVIRDIDEIVRTRNFILDLDKDLKIISGTEVLDVSGIPLYPKNIRGIEDIRLFGSNEFFCTYLEVNSERIPQMCYCQYDTGNVTKIIPLMMGDKLQCEKNWVPFIMNDEVHFIYQICPLKIYKLNRETGAISPVKETTLTPLFFNDFRGSSGLIPYKNGWLCTIHQVYHSGPDRKYFHRFLWFNQDFTYMKYSEVFFFENREIEYTLSLCHSNQGLLVPYSQLDNTSKIGVLNYEILDSWLKL